MTCYVANIIAKESQHFSWYCPLFYIFKKKKKRMRNNHISISLYLRVDVWCKDASILIFYIFIRKGEKTLH